MLHRVVPATLLSFVCATALGQSDTSGSVSAAVAKYASDETMAIAVVEMDGQWVSGVQQIVSQVLGADAADIANQPAFPMALGLVESLRAAGAREFIVFVGLNDLNPNTGPLGVFTTSSTEQAKGIAQMVGGLLTMAPKGFADLSALANGQDVLVGQTKTIDHYVKTKASERPDLQRPLTELVAPSSDRDESRAAIVVALGEQPGRVVGDLWPALPEPFAAADGHFVANDVQSISGLLVCPPTWRTEMVIRTANDAAAGKVEQLLDAAWRKLIEQLSTRGDQPHLVDLAKRASSILVPEREGTTIVIRASHDDSEVGEMVRSVVVPAIESARASARRIQQMNQFKQMALAILNFESANRFLPASAAIVDEDRQPLLSWRVAVLPYTEQGALYRQFHLDEPWDSPHNLQLVKQMPDIYADANHPELASEGKTTFQVPWHERSIFPPLADDAVLAKRSYEGRTWRYAEGTRFRDVTDGTSNTVLIVQTPSEDAVVWTKPADWQVDLARAWAQLKGKKTTGSIVSAFCDGSARAWNVSQEELENQLPKLITRDGTELIE